MRVTKRTLGEGYLAGTGALLGAVALGVGLVGLRANAGAAIGIISGVIPSLSLASARYWLGRTGLDDEGIWRVAVWAGVGIGLLTLVDAGLLLAHQLVAPVLTPSVAVVVGNVAAGGVAGALVGSVVEQRRTTDTLREKNAVLNRVLRHDLRNALGIVRAQTEMLAEEVPADDPRISIISRQIDHVVDLAETARKIQRTLDRDRTGRGPIDVVPVVERRVDDARGIRSDATVETDLPPEAWVRADELFGSVVGNLLDNAVRYGGAEPTVRVTVSRRRGVTREGIELRIEDDGPGIPRSELDVLASGEEPPLDHTSGTGLWLVKWLVEHYGGSVSFGRSDLGGAEVVVELQPAAGRPTRRHAESESLEFNSPNRVGPAR